MKSSLFWPALKSGLIVGLLDGIAACVNAYIQHSVSPASVLRYIASGAFGKSAFAGGLIMESWGLFFHFFIAISWTFLFFIAFTKLKMLQVNKFLVGFGYGLFVWLMMNLVVLPLSNVPPLNFRLVPTSIMIAIHMVVVGLSISLLANQFFSKKS